MGRKERLGALEALGLRPFGKAAREIALALRGDAHTPATLFGPSSLRILKPSISIPTWLGRRRPDGLAPLYNFVNRALPPLGSAPHSVRVTSARDWRGGRFTYDGHFGTDFAVPVGTVVVAAAPGRVLWTRSELDRGGLKVAIDHGRGLVTMSNHLGRALVRPGERVRRGRPIALAGASGVDLLLCFPWVSPHLHYTILLNGEPADPFARAAEGETPLWRAGNSPVPDDGTGPDDYEPTAWDPALLEKAAEACKAEETRRRLRAMRDPEALAAELLFLLNYRPWRFTERRPLYPRPFPREPRLDLPLRAEDFRGVKFPDDGFGEGAGL